MGPLMDTAAMTLPLAARTGADTDAMPGSRSPMDWAHPRRRTADKSVAVNFAPSAQGPTSGQVSSLRAIVDVGRRATIECGVSLGVARVDDINGLSAGR
mgnify:CR=1 FL=1